MVQGCDLELVIKKLKVHKIRNGLLKILKTFRVNTVPFQEFLQGRHIS